VERADAAVGSTFITVERADFRVYRRDKREAIPTICPPEA
jgi:hypothetical protein